ncbi:MAG: hypothetical protein AAF611_15855 [Bacteroidota bacterium]
MAKFKIDLPDTATIPVSSWSGTTFQSPSLWGNGNSGQNLWGWTGGAPLTVSAPILKNSDWYIEVEATNPDPGTGELLAFITRYTLSDGSKGVFGTGDITVIP